MNPLSTSKMKNDAFEASITTVDLIGNGVEASASHASRQHVHENRGAFFPETMFGRGSYRKQKRRHKTPTRGVRLGRYRRK